MNTRLGVSALACLLLAAACSTQQPPSAPAPPAAGPAAPPRAPDAAATRPEISVQDLRTRIGILAHDSMRGRESGSPEGRKAGEYIARELMRLGLRPAGDAGTFFQAVPLERTTTRLQASAVVGGAPRALGAGDLRVISGFAGVPSTSRTSGSGPVVYAGYMFDPTPGGPELTPRQLDGAVAIVRLGAPPGIDETRVPPRIPVAALLGPGSPAEAVLLVAEGEMAEFWEYAGEVARKGSVALRRQLPTGEGPPIFLVAPELVELLLARSLDGARQPKADLGTIDFQLAIDRQRFDDHNIVGVLPGTDAVRSAQYVTLGAHYDHVGVGAPVDGDSIYNGADDNASGTVALLELAEMLASQPQAERPARSVLFLWNAAEEAGLLGSEHFTDRPTVNRTAMIAHVNLDMIGRNGTDSLFVIGSRRLSTEFGDWLEQVNSALPRPFTLDYTFDAPDHPEKLYCRSDHWNFARFGIPSVMIGSGLHEDYHQPSDHAEKLNYEKMQRLVELTAALVEKVADGVAAPTIDNPAPPLGTPCEG